MRLTPEERDLQQMIRDAHQQIQAGPRELSDRDLERFFHTLEEAQSSAASAAFRQRLEDVHAQTLARREEAAKQDGGQMVPALEAQRPDTFDTLQSLEDLRAKIRAVSQEPAAQGRGQSFDALEAQYSAVCATAQQCLEDVRSKAGAVHRETTKPDGLYPFHALEAHYSALCARLRQQLDRLQAKARAGPQETSNTHGGHSFHALEAQYSAKCARVLQRLDAAQCNLEAHQEEATPEVQARLDDAESLRGAINSKMHELRSHVAVVASLHDEDVGNSALRVERTAQLWELVGGLEEDLNLCSRRITSYELKRLRAGMQPVREQGKWSRR